MKRPAGKGQIVAYLDFDGCVHHEAVYWKPRVGPFIRAAPHYRLFEHVELLESLLEPYPDVRIVLSTSWVVRYGYGKVLKRLPEGLRERCIGATYHSEMTGDAWHSIPRGEQISRDVARRRPRAWLALDDDDEGWPSATRQHLVKTDPCEGISPVEVQMAIAKKLQRLQEENA